MADMNIFKNGGFVLPKELPSTKYSEPKNPKTLKEKVFDFFTKEENKQEQEEFDPTKLPEKIYNAGLRVARTEKILNEGYPPAGQNINIVF